MTSHSMSLLQSSTSASTYVVKHCSSVPWCYLPTDVPVSSVAPSSPYTPSVLFQIGSHPQRLLQADIPSCHMYLQYRDIKSPPWWAVTAGMRHNAHGNLGLKNATFLSYVLGPERWLMVSRAVKNQPLYIRIHNSAPEETGLEHCEQESVYITLFVDQRSMPSRGLYYYKSHLRLNSTVHACFHSIWISSTTHQKDRRPNISVQIQPLVVASSQVQVAKT